LIRSADICVATSTVAGKLIIALCQALVAKTSVELHHKCLSRNQALLAAKVSVSIQIRHAVSGHQFIRTGVSQ